VPPFNPPLVSDEVDQALPGRYRAIQVLKSGGQGAVFRVEVGFGHSAPPGALLALKMYSADQLEERTDREIETLSHLHVDTLVEFVGTGRVTVRGLPCVWLETTFIEGEPLSSVLQRGPLPVPQIARIASDIGVVLDRLWERRIVHRDVKPDNIMLRADGRAILVDLGIARYMDMESLTTAGKTWGTVGYFSPEQFRAVRALTCKSDVFALGVVVQECLLGRHPTARRQPQLADGGPATAALRPALPAEFCAFVDRMVHRDPVRRPAPSEVVAAMQSFSR
jgi:serine/threonine protein kinase